MVVKQDKNYLLAKKLLNLAGVTINGSAEYDITVHNSDFYARVFKQGSLGLGESYIDGWWDCPRLDIFFSKVLSAKIDQHLQQSWGDLFRVIGFKIRNKQTKKKAKQVAEEHYDLGNDLFAQILDPYMQYSCGYWRATNVNNLAQAQIAKLKLIAQKLNLKPGMTLLDIGCGWGGLAKFMAENYQVKVVGITISREQLKLSQDRCKGLDVEFALADYRDLKGQFDRIVSVGMFEHVGTKNYRAFFNKVSDLLVDDGVFLLHTIGANTSGVHTDSWLDKYVFANGVIPSITQVASELEDQWIMEDWHNFGADYDLTLMAWQEKFIANWSHLENDYSPRFYRMFNYYLTSCASLFRVRQLQLWQLLLTKVDSQVHLENFRNKVVE